MEKNQSALILDIGEDGDITVNVASGDHDGLTRPISRKSVALAVTSDGTPSQ